MDGDREESYSRRDRFQESLSRMIRKCRLGKEDKKDTRKKGEREREVTIPKTSEKSWDENSFNTPCCFLLHSKGNHKKEKVLSAWQFFWDSKAGKYNCILKMLILFPSFSGTSFSVYILPGWLPLESHLSTTPPVFLRVLCRIPSLTRIRTTLGIQFPSWDSFCYSYTWDDHFLSIEMNEFQGTVVARDKFMSTSNNPNFLKNKWRVQFYFEEISYFIVYSATDVCLHRFKCKSLCLFLSGRIWEEKPAKALFPSSRF